LNSKNNNRNSFLLKFFPLKFNSFIFLLLNNNNNIYNSCRDSKEKAEMHSKEQKMINKDKLKIKKMFDNNQQNGLSSEPRDKASAQ